VPHPPVWFSPLFFSPAPPRGHHPRSRDVNNQCLVQTGPASVVNVLLSENQPFTAIEGAP
jgi:hypothetical protein